MIGGQAVNYWAERYLAKEPELRKYIPFTSGDIDFRGNRDDVRHIAGQLELRAVFPDKVSMTSLAGAIPLHIGKLPSNIEIVRLIPGVSIATVDALAIGAELSGQQIRVLDPISLLLCKVNLAMTVRQENRQDVVHLKILIFCVRGFLRDVLREVEQGNAPAKGWLGAVNKLAKLVKSTHGRRAVQKFETRWAEILPLAEIAKCKNEKIVSFREKQLARVFGSSLE
ncbi:MAG: hypothetical protein RLZZ350_458 [Verrucomicrobiota bacterium]